MSEQGYFAAREADEVAAVLTRRSTTFYQNLYNNQFIDKLRKMWRFYHGAFTTSVSGAHEVTFTGDESELVRLPVNHFRNLARHIYNMITSNRVVMEAKAVNTDYKSLSQTFLANGILDYYMRQKNLEECFKLATEYAIVLGAGFVKLGWDVSAGEPIDFDEETGQYNFQGDVSFTALSALDVVVDGSKENWDNDWVLTRTWKNKYDLAAKYPELKDEIIGIRTKGEQLYTRFSMWTNDETDDIAVYEFFHKPTDSLPEGRYIMYLDGNVVLLDAKMPYRQIPVYRIAPSNILGTPYGYSPMFDVFPIQEAINATVSAIMTNQNAFAVQSLFVPRGADIAVNTIGEGMQIVEGNAQPVPLNMTATAKETFDFLSTLIQQGETISGINSVVRGNPEASLKSGTALALVQSMSIQFMSELQNSYVKLVESVGTAILMMIRDFAASPRVVAIVGKNNRTALKEFMGEDLNSINRVIVDVGNPLSRTISGRVQMAEQLLQMKLFKSPEQYFMVLETGKLETAFEGDIQQLLLIKRENEMFLDGKNPLVAPTDSHSLHINEHNSVLSDPSLRENPELVKNVMDHIQEHLDALENTDPRLLQIIGQQPIQPLEQMMNAGGQPQGPGEGVPPANSVKGNTMEGVLGAPNGGENNISGGAIDNPNGENLPNLPQVPAENLVNPSLQDNSLGNVQF